MALCFIAVLGIVLASYIAVCSRTMQLSNRSFQGGLSKQLAEFGLEEGLRAFNNYDWAAWSANPTGITGATTAWTLDTTNKRASRTITFTSAKLGQGVTATVKIRIDNYDVAELNATWSSSANYRANDLVGRSGIWYRAVQSSSNQTPNGMVNMAYWVPEPVTSVWNVGVTYKPQDVVYYVSGSSNGWYRYSAASNSSGFFPTNTSYWTPITKVSIDAGYSGINNEVLDYYGTWYYYNSSASPYWFSTPSPPNSYAPVVSWTWRQSYNYAFNDLVCYGYPAIWYRCKTAHTSSGSILPTNTTYWENALTGMWGWNSGITYNRGDVIYYSSTSQWYRCLVAHTSSGSITPASTTYWSNAPKYSATWDPGQQYSQYDTVRYNGTWYLSLQNTNAGRNPATDTTYWIGAGTTSSTYLWSATTAYAANAYKCYGGVWYKCLTANTGISPNNTTYWTPTWANASGVTSGAPVIYVEATVSIPNNPPARTQLRSTIDLAPLFPNAAAASTTLTINGGTAGTVDSYDGTMTAMSANGIYSTYSYGQATTPFSASPNWNKGYSAVLAAGGATSPSITVGDSTNVKGYVAAISASASPYAPIATFGTSATVKNASSPGTPNVDTTQLSRSVNIPQFDTHPTGGAGALAAAFTAGTLAMGTQIPASSGTTYYLGSPGATVPSIYYFDKGDSTCNIGTGYDMAAIVIEGPVILYVNGYLRVRSGGIIDIKTSGSLEIHCTYFRTYTGSDGIYNRTLDPKRLTIISDTSATNANYLDNGSSATNTDFRGTIYQPNTAASLGLEVRTGVNVYGALSAKKMTFVNEADVHYDTSLRYTSIPGVDQPYAVTEWRELPVAELATMP